MKCHSKELAFQYLKAQKLDDGTGFEESYRECGLVFSVDDIENVKPTEEGLSILFWRGNSNLYWPVKQAEWEEFVASQGVQP